MNKIISHVLAFLGGYTLSSYNNSKNNKIINNDIFNTINMDNNIRIMSLLLFGTFKSIIIDIALLEGENYDDIVAIGSEMKDDNVLTFLFAEHSLNRETTIKKISSKLSIYKNIFNLGNLSENEFKNFIAPMVEAINTVKNSRNPLAIIPVDISEDIIINTEYIANFMKHNSSISKALNNMIDTDSDFLKESASKVMTKWKDSNVNPYAIRILSTMMYE